MQPFIPYKKNQILFQGETNQKFPVDSFNKLNLTCTIENPFNSNTLNTRQNTESDEEEKIRTKTIRKISKVTETEEMSDETKKKVKNIDEIKLSKIQEISSMRTLLNEDSLNSIFSALKDQKEMILSKPVILNILVCGESGIGKTSFINAFHLVNIKRFLMNMKKI